MPVEEAVSNGRKALTLIEILVVIGIIAVLATIVIIQLGRVSDQGSEQDTRKTLSNCKAMLDAGAHTNAMAGVPQDPVDAPGQGVDWRTQPAVLRTRDVFARLAGLPENKRALENLPQERTMTLPGAMALASVPVPLDGWSNPVVYVPRAGLRGVRVGSAAPTIIQAKDQRAFFASAGPDGNFQTGDDNLYSFDN